jgi:hypothetical protein
MKKAAGGKLAASGAGKAMTRFFYSFHYVIFLFCLNIFRY